MRKSGCPTPTASSGTKKFPCDCRSPVGMNVQVGETAVNEMAWRIDAKLAELEFEWGPFELQVDVGGDVEVELELISSE